MSKVLNLWGKSKKEFTDVLYLIVLQGVNQLLPLIIMPYLMIILGADKYGYVSFSQSFIQYFVLIVDFGFNLSATKRIAVAGENKQKISMIFYSTLYVKLLLLLLCIIVFIIILFFVDRFTEYVTALLCTFPLVIGTTFTFFWVYQGIGKVRIMTIINTLSKILMLPCIFLFVKAPDDYPLAAFIQSSVYLLTALISCWYLFRWKIIEKVHVSFKNIVEEIKESYPLFLSIASTSIYTQLFIVILGFISTPDIVGKYSAAERIMRALCLVLCTPINQVFYPKLSYLSKFDTPEAKNLFLKILLLIVILMFSVSLLLFFCGGIISSFLGKDYEGIGLLLKIFSLAPFAIGIGGVVGQMGLVALGGYKAKCLFQRVYFIAAPFSLIAVAVLAPFFLEKGAAIALVLTEYFVFMLMLFYYKKTSNIKYNK